MLKKAFVKAVRVPMAKTVEPTLIRRHVVSHFIAKTLEDLSCNFRAFLRTVGRHRVQCAELWRDLLKEAQLLFDLRAAGVPLGAVWRIRKNRLPAARNKNCRIAGEKGVQKCGPASRKPRDEN